jgi:hypothetical protein
MKTASLVLLTIAAFILFSAYLVSSNRSNEFRQCIEHIKTNDDGVTLDNEDLELCKKAYDNRTSFAEELRRAVERSKSKSVMKLL